MSEIKKWKIIRTDNYGRETVSHTLLCENITSEEIGKLFVATLNSSSSRNPSDWYRLVSQEHKLYVWEP